MSDENWITDPDAIDTIVALGLEEGDEILVRGDDIIDVPPKYNDKVATVIRTDWGMQPGDLYHEDNSETIVANVNLEGSDNWVLCRKNIKAWRRPVKRHG